MLNKQNILRCWLSWYSKSRKLKLFFLTLLWTYQNSSSMANVWWLLPLHVSELMTHMKMQRNSIMTWQEGQEITATWHEDTWHNRDMFISSLLFSDEEAMMRRKYPGAAAGRSALLEKRLSAAGPRKYFDSGDYNLAKEAAADPKHKNKVIISKSFA